MRTAISRRSAVLALATLALLTALPIGGGSPAEAAPLPRQAELDGLPAADVQAEAADSAPTVSKAVRAPIPFSTVGFEIPPGATVEFRTAPDGTEWSGWQLAELPDGGPDPDSAEGRRQNDRASEPYWVHEAAHLQVRVADGEPANVGVVLLDSRGLSQSLADQVKASLRRPWVDTTPAEAATKPGIVSRSSWDPYNSCAPRSAPSYASTARYAVVHHTAGSNNYSSAAQARAQLLDDCLYHRNTLRWNDLGYNIVADKWGNVYEGRAGGPERAVIGAHAAGHNTGSIGISVLGNYETAGASTGLVDAIARTLAWKFQLHQIDPKGSVIVNGRRIPTIVGHRDVGQTACPGRNLYSQLPTIRTEVARQVGASFSDIGGLSHRTNILRIANAGITTGCGGSRYCPEGKVTRAQMATFLKNASRLTPRWGEVFSDVPATHTHGPDIHAIARQGITRSCNSASGGDRYCPRRGVTRAEMATFLVRSIPGIDPNADGSRFRDVPSGSSHQPAINAIADTGITVGCGDKTTFCPERTVTRAEMATFISRAMDAGLG